MKDFYDLFTSELKRTFSAEAQLASALPKIIKATSSPKLREVLSNYLKETKQKVSQLEGIGSEMNINLTGTECEAVRSLLKETSKIVNGRYDRPTSDAAVILAFQRILHYQMASYGSLRAFANQFNINTVEKWLAGSCDEAGEVDKKLTQIAEGTYFTHVGINDVAVRKCA